MEIPNKKKVLFLITKSNWGGAQRYVFDLATHLDKSKFSTLIASGENGELNESLSHQHIGSVILPNLKNSLDPVTTLKAAKELWSLLKHERPDILHVNSSVAGLLGVIIGGLLRVPRIIFTAHGWAFNEGRPWWQKKLFWVLHGLTVLLSDRTIAVSAAVAKQLNFPGTASKMKVVYLGRTIGPMYEKLEARQLISGEHPALIPYIHDEWIGCVAELHPIKRHELIIEAFFKHKNTHPNLRLVLIGAGSEYKKLKSMIEHYGLTKNVFLVGAIHEAARILKAFDLFTLMSHSEAGAYVITEAGLAGVPVVASEVGGIPETINSGKSGLLLNNPTPEELSGAYTGLLANEAQMQSYQEELYTIVSGRTLESMVRATEALYTL
jgi:glycosyltransferase involved in cell wall biosynthesis